MRRQIETIILVSVIILCLVSVVAVFSTTMNSAAMQNIYLKQIAAIFIGMIFLGVIRFFPYKILVELSTLFYVLSVLMLILVLVFGTEVHGGRRWFNLGLFHIQPVEFAKVSVILFLAYIIEKYRSFLYSAVIVIIVILLVAAQPDAGSAIPFIFIFSAMMAISKINTRWMVIAVPAVVIVIFTLFFEIYLNVGGKTLLGIKYLLYPVSASVIIYLIFRELRQLKKNMKSSYLIWILLIVWISPVVGVAGSNLIKGYQKNRIASFIMPEIDPLGAGYTIRQSLLAVGSGRISGRGLFSGTQTQLGFLPVRHTDFIFSSIAEEMGFIGISVLLFLFALFLWQCIRIIERSGDYSGRLIATGIFSLIFTQVAMNIAVAIGWMPVVGIQLPFVSYGGTGMVVFLSLIGILLNVNIQKGHY